MEDKGCGYYLVVFKLLFFHEQVIHWGGSELW